MSDRPINPLQPSDAVAPYEPPIVRPLGNVRDLLAGNFGTQPDGSPPDPDQPTIPA
jgi:hypothetical protein